MVAAIIIIALSITLRVLTWLSRRGNAHSQQAEQHKQHLTDLRREMLLDGRLKPKQKPYGDPQGFTPDTIRPVWNTPSKASIRQLASQYMNKYSEALDATRYLYREIIANGGIKPYRNSFLQDEYINNIPTWYRRKNGLPPDEMASTLMYDSDSDLYAAISNAEISRQTLISQKVSFQTLLKHAEEDLIDQLNPPTE